MYRIGDEELKELEKVITSRKLFRVGNKEAGHPLAVETFESELSEKIGTKYALCLSGGGTSALICALVGLGIGPGDEVIVPGYTFMASALAALAVGAIPVPVEIDESLMLDPYDFERKITPNTKVVMPVHMAGLAAAMEKINKIAEQNNIKVVEDACQADGITYRGKRVGNWGDAGAFSFNYAKIITSGDGGALVTNSREVYERALVYHDGGAFIRPYKRDLHIDVFIGVQLRASEIMGAVLRAQLRRLDGILEDIGKVRATILSALENRPGISFAKYNDPERNQGTVIPFSFDSEEKARKFAKSDGVNGWLPIDTGRHIYSNWEPIFAKRVGGHPLRNPFNHPANKELRTEYTHDMCPKTLDICSKTVFISLSPDWTEEQVEKVVDSCKKAGANL
ncbi:DegT/DnrJ/EryC1/StrS family aminotransferase [bacterium]|nr:DegT/DnrJ/EryC1/StrS family aminotransferase [bacterium]